MVKVVKFLIGFFITVTIIVVGFCIYVINADNSSNPLISTLNSLVGQDDVFTTLSNVGTLMNKVDMDTINTINEIANDSQKMDEIKSAIKSIDTATLVEMNNIVQNIDPEIVSDFKEIISDVDINSLTSTSDVSQVLDVLDLSTIVEITDLVGELDTQTKVDLQTQLDGVIQDDDVSSLIAQFLK